MGSVVPHGRMSRSDVLAWLLIIAVALLPRLVALDADPPASLGTAFLTDEGWWSHNARHWALFGEWVLDDQNLPLYTTPGYTMALAAVYKLLGVGFFQTRLVSALSGAFTCILIYGFLRRRDRRIALASSLILACSYPMLLHNRVGLTESFQVLFLVLTAIAVIKSLQSPVWGAAAGLFLVLALLAKASAIIMVIILPVFWATHWYASRRGFTPVFSWRPVFYCIGAGVLAGLLLFVAVALPHWAELRQHMVSPLMSSMGALKTERISLFGLPIGFAINEFYLASAVLLVAVALLALNRLSDRLARVDEVELFCWVWLVVALLFLSVITYQPFRRFLIIMPPLAMLAGYGLVTGGLKIPGGHAWKKQATGFRVLAAAITGAVVAYYAARGLAPMAVALTGGLSVGGDLGISPLTMQVLLWHGCFFAVAIVGYVGLGRMPARGLAVPALAFVALFVVAEPVRFLVDTFPASYTIRDTSRGIDAYARSHGLHYTALIGNTSDTFAMETNLFAFTIRNWKERRSYMNKDGWTRFRPALAVELRKSEIYSIEEIELRNTKYKLAGNYEIWPRRSPIASVRIGFFRVQDANPRVFFPRLKVNGAVVGNRESPGPGPSLD